jgi:hypothetical protein
MSRGTRYLYQCRFIGRKSGAIGVMYHIDHIVGSDFKRDRESVVAELYNSFEHITRLSVVDMDGEGGELE